MSEAYQQSKLPAFPTGKPSSDPTTYQIAQVIKGRHCFAVNQLLNQFAQHELVWLNKLSDNTFQIKAESNKKNCTDKSCESDRTIPFIYPFASIKAS